MAKRAEAIQRQVVANRTLGLIGVLMSHNNFRIGAPQ
jgi:hypothetical protein